MPSMQAASEIVIIICTEDANNKKKTSTIQYSAFALKFQQEHVDYHVAQN